MGSNDYGRTPNVWQPSEVPNPNTGNDYGVGQAAQFGPTTTTTTTEFGYPPSRGWNTIVRNTTTIQKNPSIDGTTLVFDTFRLNSKLYTDYLLITAWSIEYIATTVGLLWGLRTSPRVTTLTPPDFFSTSFSGSRRGVIIFSFQNVHVAGLNTSDSLKFIQFTCQAAGSVGLSLSAGDAGAGTVALSTFSFLESNLPLDAYPATLFTNLLNTPGEHDLQVVVNAGIAGNINIARTLFWLRAR